MRREWDRSRVLLGLGASLLLGVVLTLAFLPTLRARFFPRDRVWARVQQSSMLRVGMDPSFPPFESLDENGTPVGYDVDLARALAAELGVQAEFVSIGFDGLIDAVRTEKVDVAISAMPYDPLLTKDVRFSTPYFDAGWRVVVPRASRLRTLADLNGARVAVEWGSEGDVWARRLRQTHPGMSLVLKPALADALAALTAGDADAAIVDGVTAREHAGELRQLGPPLSSEPYVIVMPYRAPVLQREINRALDRLRAQGALERIEKRWFDHQ